MNELSALADSGENDRPSDDEGKQRQNEDETHRSVTGRQDRESERDRVESEHKMEDGGNGKTAQAWKSRRRRCLGESVSKLK